MTSRPRGVLEYPPQLNVRELHENKQRNAIDSISVSGMDHRMEWNGWRPSFIRIPFCQSVMCSQTRRRCIHRRSKVILNIITIWHGFVVELVVGICVRCGSVVDLLISHVLVASRLDYCNSVLCGVSKSNIEKLQRMQNNLARVFCKSLYNIY